MENLVRALHFLHHRQQYFNWRLRYQNAAKVEWQVEDDIPVKMLTFMLEATNANTPCNCRQNHIVVSFERNYQRLAHEQTDKNGAGERYEHAGEPQ